VRASVGSSPMPKFRRVADDDNELHSGWLVVRKSRLLRPPKRRFMRLTAETLSYYKTEEAFEARGWTRVDALESLVVQCNASLPERDPDKYGITLKFKGGKSPWMLHAGRKDAMEAWLIAFRTVGLCPPNTGVGVDGRAGGGGTREPGGDGGNSDTATYCVHLPNMSGCVDLW